ncbi:hypothetical protein HAX54_013117 [Datura stramonium]|uniref:Uncharacterized protein n=1 Tax=Datura stramonium TaxID=4076 RepID=A0ABS8TMK0_DATST|nr:hypothetical protein [Datura stramonium]
MGDGGDSPSHLSIVELMVKGLHWLIPPPIPRQGLGSPLWAMEVPTVRQVSDGPTQRPSLRRDFQAFILKGDGGEDEPLELAMAHHLGYQM